jgi:tetratricopeptide (TPR) repeat protein
MKLRTLSLLFFLGIIHLSQAQTKSVLKAREYYAAGKYVEAQKMCEKGLENDKSTTELWFIKAISEYEMYLLPKYRKGDVDYFKEAMKSAVKAKGYDDDGEYFLQYGERFNALVVANNKEAISNYGQGRYPRALQMYKNSYDLTGDTIALGMAGHCYWMLKQNLDAVKTMRKVANMNYLANAEGKHKKTYVREAFEVLTDYYLNERKLTDSALIYCEMGLSVFPLNQKLLAWERSVVDVDLATTRSNTGYSQMYNQLLTKALFFFPSDTFYLHEQNNYYLNRLGYLAENNDWAEAETVFQDYFNRKVDLLDRKSKNSTDPFLIKDSFAFINQCLEYYLANNAKGGTVFFFYKWYPIQFNTTPITEKKLETLLNNPPTSVSRRLIGMLMDHGGEKYPKNLNLKKSRLNTFNAWTKQKIAYYDWARIISLSDSVIKDFPKNTTLKPLQQSLLAKAADSLMAKGLMEPAWSCYYRLQKDNPKFLGLGALQIKLAKRDFDVRFKGSKIAYATIKGKKVAQTGWTGNSKTCTAGSLPDSTIAKITNRINYFRQNAGVTKGVMFDMDKHVASMQAATMYAPIGVFSRTPKPETHKCFTAAAADAAVYGTAILESNPAQSATVIMSDDKSEELYNRRLLTHPGMVNYGFGCAENNSVFWLADKNIMAVDTAYYKEHFIAWPAAGATPAMLVFDRWSFSLLQPLEEATVAILSKKHGNIESNSSVQPGNGLGLPTLAITPLGMTKWEAGDEIKITITLKNKKSYSYTTTLF